MKLPLVGLAVCLGISSANAEHYYQTSHCAVQPVVAYTQPVVYQAPVVYTAPVVYQAPVYYAGAVPAYSEAVYSPPQCQSPNVIISGHGAYRSSWDTSPTVIYIGRNHASHGMLPGRRCR